MTNSYTGLEATIAARVAQKAVPASVTSFLSRLQIAKDTRCREVNLHRHFAEFNDLVRKGKREREHLTK